MNCKFVVLGLGVATSLLLACSNADEGTAGDDANVTGAPATSTNPVACIGGQAATRTKVECALSVGDVSVTLKLDPKTKDLKATNGDFVATVWALTSDRPEDFSAFFVSLESQSKKISEIRSTGTVDGLAMIDARLGFTSPRTVAQYLNTDRTDEVVVACTPK